MNIFRRKKPIKEEDRETFEFISQLKMFAGLKNREITYLSRLIHRREYKAGERIFKKNYPNIAFYIVHKGEVKIFLDNPKGEEIELERKKENSYFGEIGLFLDYSRTASCKAEKKTILYAISKREFQSFINKFPRGSNKILLHLGKILCENIVQLNEKIFAKISEEEK